MIRRVNGKVWTVSIIPIGGSELRKMSSPYTNARSKEAQIIDRLVPKFRVRVWDLERKGGAAKLHHNLYLQHGPEQTLINTRLQ